MNTFRTASLIILFLLTPVISCSSGKGAVYKKTMPLMDTVISITVIAESADTAEQAIDTAFAEISLFGDLINLYSDKSELAEINRNAGVQRVKVSPLTLAVIEAAVSAAEKSGGAFDPTLGPIITRWDFLKGKRPTEIEIADALPLVNYKYILIDRADGTVFLKRKGMILDLGGIAKGYAADLAVESLKKAGIIAGLVSIAGDIKTFGMKPDKRPWTIGIKNPRQTGEKDDLVATIRLSDKAISTSGDYERYFISGDKRYHHLLVPETGMPAYGCRSVSIIADRAVDADAFSTAVFILGPDRGMALVRTLGMDAMIIDSNGAMHITDPIKETITREKSH